MSTGDFLKNPKVPEVLAGFKFCWISCDFTSLLHLYFIVNFWATFCRLLLVWDVCGKLCTEPSAASSPAFVFSVSSPSSLPFWSIASAGAPSCWRLRLSMKPPPSSSLESSSESTFTAGGEVKIAKTSSASSCSSISTTSCNSKCLEHKIVLFAINLEDVFS